MKPGYAYKLEMASSPMSGSGAGYANLQLTELDPTREPSSTYYPSPGSGPTSKCGMAST